MPLTTHIGGGMACLTRYSQVVSNSVRLEIVEGPSSGQVVDVMGPVVIGRDPGADIALHDERISRRHVRLTPAGPTSVTVDDLGSSNGTFINQNPVNGSATLNVGDELLIGVTLMQIQGVAGVAQPSLVRPIPQGLAAPERPPTYVNPVGSGDTGIPELDPLLDSRTKVKARYAPIAVSALVVIAVLLYLATN